MAYLKNENNEIIVDAILTKYGREKLAKDGKLGIVKFALFDDEVDYTLYNTSHPDGELYYDVAIRELPVIEALPNSDAILKYKLFTTKDVISNVNMRIQVDDLPSSFTSGISLINQPYTFTPGLIPSPTIEDKNLIYYILEIDSPSAYFIEAIGNINQDIGLTNYIVESRNFYKDTDTVKYAVGHSFTLKIKTRPRFDTVFSGKIISAGPVAVTPYQFTFKVLGTSVNI